MKSVVILVVVFLLSWFIYTYYAGPVIESLVDDVQAYQEKSLLPEDN